MSSTIPYKVQKDHSSRAQRNSDTISPPDIRSLTQASGTSQQTKSDCPSSNFDVTVDIASNVSTAVRKFRPLRFAIGLLCTAFGMAMILGIGGRVIEMRQFGEDAAMPLVTVCVVVGVMSVGGGFGIMATSSSGFDEAEFDRLAAAGNISSVTVDPHDVITDRDKEVIDITAA